uniref:WD_REPEATS_REGION domain-containing protein n=1 Tax=Caenorhabditis japonica TaxID=281687 RepID=A0A8R1HVD4_CAEJA
MSRDFRLEILNRLAKRECHQKSVKDMFKNYQLLNEQLQQAHRTRSVSSHEQFDGATSLASMKEEMANVYRMKSKNDQDLIDANRKLTDTEARYSHVMSQRNKLRIETEKMEAKLKDLEKNISEMKEQNVVINNDRVALLATVTALTEKKTQMDIERFQLLNKIRELQEKSAEVMNAEIVAQEERAQRRIAEQIASATDNLSLNRDERVLATFGTSPETSDEFLMSDVLPTEIKFKMTAHDGEVNDVEWLSDDQFATAGSDTTVRVWRVSPNKTDAQKVTSLTGCLGAVNRLDYDCQRHVLLASSNDKTCRLWNVDSQRLLSTFSGHTDKVTAARLFQEHNVVSGSADRTIRQWDISSIRCVRSYFVGSTVFDVAAKFGSSKTCFVSAHFDRKVRFWDSRTSEASHSVDLGHRAISLDISMDGIQLLASSRDDTLSLIDVRNYGILHLYSAEQYKTNCDNARAIFSSTGEFVLAGSSNSSVYIWNTKTTKLEKVVKTARADAAQILSLSWNPSGRGLLACDRHKTCTLWR